MYDYIQNKEQYDLCVRRLNYLKTVNPQTENIKMEIEMISIEVKNFEKAEINEKRKFFKK